VPFVYSHVTVTARTGSVAGVGCTGQGRNEDDGSVGCRSRRSIACLPGRRSGAPVRGLSAQMSRISCRNSSTSSKLRYTDAKRT
jgi:hypothetical protein